MNPSVRIHQNTHCMHMVIPWTHFQSCRGFPHDLPALHDFPALPLQKITVATTKWSHKLNHHLFIATYFCCCLATICLFITETLLSKEEIIVQEMLIEKGFTAIQSYFGAFKSGTVKDVLFELASTYKNCNPIHYIIPGSPMKLPECQP